MAAREPRIRTTNDTVNAAAREQNAQFQPDTMYAPITIFNFIYLILRGDYNL